MKKVALVLGLVAIILYSRGKHDSYRPRKPKSEGNSLVQLQNAGMCKMTFGVLRKTLGTIDVGNYAIENESDIVLIETFNHNVNVKGYNKMIDNFNSLYDTNNETLMKTYQGYSGENCKKIYGCVGTISDPAYDWKILKFLPNPERCITEPTITMGNVIQIKKLDCASF